jgi:hypothetical protein
LVQALELGLSKIIVEVVADAVQNDRFMKVCDGTSQNQWSNTPKSRAMPLSTGSCCGMQPVMMWAYSS